MIYFQWIFLAFFIFSYSNVKGQNIKRAELRNLFLLAQQQKESRESLISHLENIKNRMSIEESYLGICYAYRALESSGKWEKLKIALKARKHLNLGVELMPKDPECRFLRFVLEHYLPSFLGLNKNIGNDLSVIFANIHFVDENPALKKEVLSFIKKTNRCTESQSEILDIELKKAGPN